MILLVEEYDPFEHALQRVSAGLGTIGHGGVAASGGFSRHFQFDRKHLPCQFHHAGEDSVGRGLLQFGLCMGSGRDTVGGSGNTVSGLNVEG